MAQGGTYFETYKKEIWAVLGDMMGHMLVRDNLVHSDLHPGNIAVVANADGTNHEPRNEWWRPIKDILPERVVATFEVNGFGRQKPNFSVYLLDTGLVTELSGRSKDVFRRTITSLMQKDCDGIKAVCVDAHAGRMAEDTNVDNFGDEIASICLTCLWDMPQWKQSF